MQNSCHVIFKTIHRTGVKMRFSTLARRIDSQESLSKMLCRRDIIIIKLSAGAFLYARHI